MTSPTCPHDAGDDCKWCRREERLLELLRELLQADDDNWEQFAARLTLPLGRAACDLAALTLDRIGDGLVAGEVDDRNVQSLAAALMAIVTQLVVFNRGEEWDRE
jgi:hypothetical protein